MTQATLHPSEIRLDDPAIFEENRAHEVFRILRREAPVHWTPETENVKGFWSITKYEDIVHISRNPQIFSSERGITSFEPQQPDPNDVGTRLYGKMIITMDPPRHVRMRRLVNKGFTPRAVAAWEPHIREITNHILDGIAKKGEADFVTEVAALLPLAVICEIMGVPREDWDKMFQYTNQVLGGGDPEFQTDVPEELRGTPEGARQQINLGTAKMFQYFAVKLAEHRAQAKEDLVQVLLESEVDGQKLTDEDILWFCFLLILAGNETTRNAIAGGLLALLEHPEEKQKIRDNPGIMPIATEEIVRWTSPVLHMARVAKEDVEIRGVKIRKGERVVMWYPSANRDEDIFPDPFRFDVTRQPNDHIAFGIGEHYCLGAGFARLEIRVMFEELFRRFPDIELAGPPARLRSTFIGGIKHLPVRFTPEA